MHKDVTQAACLAMDQYLVPSLYEFFDRQRLSFLFDLMHPTDYASSVNWLFVTM